MTFRLDGTGLVVVDPYNDFISDGGKLWPRVHRYVEDCDAAIKRAADAGATVQIPPDDMFWGDRYGVVTDPFGHSWSFATHVRDLTSAEMEAGMKEAFAQHS